MCVEEYRRNRKLPIVLPNYYLLDQQEQWYPPGFTVFLSWLPDHWLKNNYWLVTPITDTLIALSLYGVLIGTTQSAVAATVGSLAYSLAWPTITDTSNLNSRPLGNLLLVGMMLSLIWYRESGYWLWLGVAGTVGYLVLMTHKMAMQLLIVMLPVMALVMWDWGPATALVLALLAALGLSEKMLMRIFKGQADILKFWNRNWKNLGAHQVLSSLVYGDEEREDRGRVFQSGARGLWLNIRHLAANPFVVPGAAAVGWLIVDGGMTKMEEVMAWWAGITYALAAMTMLIPRLRFYGEGYKYLRLAVFPVAFLIGSVFTRIGLEAPKQPLGVAFSLFYGGTGILALLAALFVILGRWRANTTLNPSVDGDLGKVLEYLKKPEVTVVLTVPTHLMDAIVYHCRKQVVWGGHSSHFRELEPMFPVFRKSLDWFVERYQVTHVVTLDNYVGAAKTAALGLRNPVFQSGEYRVFQTRSGDDTAGRNALSS